MNALQALALLLAFVLVAGVGGVLGAGLVMPAVATTSALTDNSVRLFEDLPTELEQVPLSEKSVILAADGTKLATFYDQNRIVVPLEDVSLAMQHAVIATEDRRYYEHGGVDLMGMTRAFVNNLLEKDTEGGSTLTQQYVKNALIQAALDSDDPQERADAIDAARTSEGAEGYARKLAEAKLAVALEQRMSKDQILEAYLNISQFGLSVYGVEAAAQYFFSVPASELTYLQAATIAGITKAPSDYDPERNPEAAEKRRNTVLSLMLREDYITQEEYTTGVATPLADTLKIGDVSLGCMEANSVANAGYFCDYVTKIIAQNPAFGETAQERARLLYRGGLTITTTLDPTIQAIADEEVKAGIPVDDPSGVASAISVVEPGTGKVLAMAQNRIYNPSTTAGPGETAVNYNTDSAYGSSKGFHPGSTFKPFTLAQWLKEGHAVREIIDARLRPFDMSKFNAPCTQLTGTYKFGNAEGRGGVMSVLDATRRSVNSGYIEMASQLNLCEIFETAASLGVHKANGEPVDVLPSNVLGSTEIAPLTMAAAFAAFAAEGTFCEPIAISKVVDSEGNEIEPPPANCRQALSVDIARGVNWTLEHVWQGTASAVGGLPGRRPSAGKTGTTSRNEYTWFVGYTPQIATAVWVGRPEGMIPIKGETINGRYYRSGIYGSSIAAPTWKRFMSRAHEGLPVVPFTDPSSTMLNGVQIRVPDVRGKSRADAIDILEDAGFHVRGDDPDAVFDPLPAGTVTGTSPGAGATQTRGTLIGLVVSKGPEPEPDPPPQGDDDDDDEQGPEGPRGPRNPGGGPDNPGGGGPDDP